MASQPNQIRLDDELGSTLDMGSDNLAQVHLNMNEGYYTDDQNRFDNPAIREVANTVKQVRQKFTDHHNRRINRNPKINDAQHRENMKRDLKKLDDSSMQLIRTQMVKLEGAVSAKEKELDDLANFKVDRDYINSITGAFYGLSAGEKQQHLSRMIAEKRGPELAILCNADQLLTGLNGEQRAGTRRRLHEQVSPKGLAELEQMQTALRRFEHGANGTVGQLMRLKGGLDKYTAEIERVENLTRQPSSGFPGE